jgi:hypothetical protein
LKTKILFAILSSFLLTSTVIISQDDMLSLLGKEDTPKSFTLATFKGTRLINFHTLEVAGKRTLDFRISHRFGSFNSGWYDFFGLDGGASIRLGLEYGFDGRFESGVGRTSLEKTIDGYLKYKLFRQTDDDSMPFSLTLFSSAYFTNQRDPNKALNGFDKYEDWTSRLSYVNQVIVGRKFSERFSMQLAPVLVHANLVEQASDNNNALVIAAAVRYKVAKRVAITTEYGWRATEYSNADNYDSFGIGMDIETGGHVFQIHITNSLGLTENQFLTRTNSKWGDGGMRIGFNISRVFTI